MRLARLARLVTRARPLQTGFSRLHARILRLSRGRIRRSALIGGGQPVLSLTTIGRRSGRRRSTVVAYLQEGGTYFVTAQNLGSERAPAWFLNLEANPAVQVTVGGRTFPARAQRVTGPEADRIWALLVERLPAVEAFREIAGREIPVIALRREPGST
jgi:F420H(2)-dependent quinone reductase